MDLAEFCFGAVCRAGKIGAIGDVQANRQHPIAAVKFGAGFGQI